MLKPLHTTAHVDGETTEVVYQARCLRFVVVEQVKMNRLH